MHTHGIDSFFIFSQVFSWMISSKWARELRNGDGDGAGVGKQGKKGKWVSGLGNE